MNLSKLKSYAPQARRDFIQAVKDRAKVYGLEEAKIEPIVERGEIAVIRGRDYPRAVAGKRRALEERIHRDGFGQTMEALAYTWFNRFVAIRFMELHEYLDHGLRVLSHPAGKTTPEILEKAHLIDLPGLKKDVVIDLKLAGDKDSELYRLLIVAQCNALHQAMPFLFERIGDETELLLPDNLLNTDSLIRKLVAAIDEDDWKEVEIIGWLYQFYISEKKDEVFAGLKKNQKITPENIPAATQLFTPHWIVRYLVENSLGRLWLLNRPDSRLAEKMPYYIAPVEPETDFIRISSPEEIKVCDPACGSGHMLTYAFDLLCEIYQEAGYAADEIAPKILASNLVGIEIDDRAGALAAFALAMKAAAKMGANQFLRSAIKPDICVLQNVRFTQAEMREVAALVGRDLFTRELQDTLGQFDQAKNFGSLIVPKLRDTVEVARVVRLKDFGGDLLLRDVQNRVLIALRMAAALSQKYHVLIANPPYMGRKNMNAPLQQYLVENYKESSADFFATFIERNILLRLHRGLLSMVTMDSWMFGDDYTDFRVKLLSNIEIAVLMHLGPHAFNEIKGEVVQVAAFIMSDRKNGTLVGTFVDLTDKPNSGSKEASFLTHEGRFYVASNDFYDLPRTVIAYFISEHTRSAFRSGIPLKEIAEAYTGLQTGDNPRFIRTWSEVSFSAIDFGRRPDSDNKPGEVKWVPYVKGSDFRKWYGNQTFVLDWSDDGKEIKSHKSATVRNQQFYFRSGIAYNNISSRLCLRAIGMGQIFDQKNSMFFADVDTNAKFAMSYLHAKTTPPFLRVVAPKDFGPGSMKLLPVMRDYMELYSVTEIADAATALARADWDQHEISWDFRSLPLLAPTNGSETLKTTYARLRTYWRDVTDQVQRLEEENNRIFIDAYGLQDELTPDVPLTEITLTCNPMYRYGTGVSVEALEARLLADTMREFLSSAIGCMFGRYSLDEPGLILANQGDSIEQYLAKVPKPKFAPNADNIIPLLDRDWVDGDATTRFHAFLRITFDDEHFEENLAFVETAIGKDVRKFLLRDFFADHLKRYKKRPIYWLFSSGPERAFQALVYLHRYDESTLARMRTEYVLPVQGRMAARIDQIEGDKLKAASTSLRKKLQKEQDDLKRQKEELKTFEERLRHLADQRIVLDLDDGVKANYAKFGDLLAESRAIVGAEDDE